MVFDGSASGLRQFAAETMGHDGIMRGLRRDRVVIATEVTESRQNWQDSVAIVSGNVGQ